MAWCGVIVQIDILFVLRPEIGPLMILYFEMAVFLV